MDNGAVGLHVGHNNVGNRLALLGDIANGNGAGFAVVVIATALLHADEFSKESLHACPTTRLQRIKPTREADVRRNQSVEYGSCVVRTLCQRLGHFILYIDAHHYRFHPSAPRFFEIGAISDVT